MGNFRKLNVWIKAKDLAVLIYRLSDSGKFAKDFGMRDQMRRAAVSIPSNIAEGDQLDSNLQSIKHFYIARGSAAELLTQALIANEIGYIPQEEFKKIESECSEISCMLTRLIQARAQKPKVPKP